MEVMKIIKNYGKWEKIQKLRWTLRMLAAQNCRSGYIFGLCIFSRRAFWLFETKKIPEKYCRKYELKYFVELENWCLLGC